MQFHGFLLRLSPLFTRVLPNFADGLLVVFINSGPSDGFFKTSFLFEDGRKLMSGSCGTSPLYSS